MSLGPMSSGHLAGQRGGWGSEFRFKGVQSVVRHIEPPVSPASGR